MNAKDLVAALLSEKEKSIRTSSRSPIGIKKKDGEFRVGFKGKGNEDSAYYTPHKDDARTTAADMIRRHRVGPTGKVNGVPESKWMKGAEKDIEDRGTEGVCSGSNFGGPSCRPGTRRYALAKTFKKASHKARHNESLSGDRLWTGSHAGICDAAEHLTKIMGAEIGVEDQNHELLLVSGYDGLPPIHKARVEEVITKYGLTPVGEVANVLAAVTEVKHGVGENYHSLVDAGRAVELITALQHDFPQNSEDVDVIAGIMRDIARSESQVDALRSYGGGPGVNARVETFRREIEDQEMFAHEKLDELIAHAGVTP